jgi:subtilisin-like proprotein convertase family protein
MCSMQIKFVEQVWQSMKCFQKTMIKIGFVIQVAELIGLIEVSFKLTVQNRSSFRITLYSEYLELLQWLQLADFSTQLRNMKVA